MRYMLKHIQVTSEIYKESLCHSHINFLVTKFIQFIKINCVYKITTNVNIIVKITITVIFIK